MQAENTLCKHTAKNKINAQTFIISAKQPSSYYKTGAMLGPRNDIYCKCTFWIFRQVDQFIYSFVKLLSTTAQMNHDEDTNKVNFAYTWK